MLWTVKHRRNMGWYGQWCKKLTQHAATIHHWSLWYWNFTFDKCCVCVSLRLLVGAVPRIKFFFNLGVSDNSRRPGPYPNFLKLSQWLNQAILYSSEITTAATTTTTTIAALLSTDSVIPSVRTPFFRLPLPPPHSSVGRRGSATCWMKVFFLGTCRG